VASVQRSGGGVSPDQYKIVENFNEQSARIK